MFLIPSSFALSSHIYLCWINLFVIIPISSTFVEKKQKRHGKFTTRPIYII